MLDLNQLPINTTKQVILDQIQADNKDILDVGCGTGKTTRLLARLGGRLTGLECGKAPLAAARSKSAVAEEIFVEGLGQELPFADASFDAICFFFSLHHVPVEQQVKALQEAHRVLRPKGIVYVFEPIAQGSSFDVMQPVDDETQVRAAAQNALKDVQSKQLFLEDANFKYLEYYTYADFESFKKAAIMVDEARAKALKTCEPEVLSRFSTLGEQVDGGLRFQEPVHFIKLKWS
ncbi:class I SAM-dependent methyltransferase [Alphaproteobacteria bacterium]|nr:class I SAM-dependent methyltransferase [Alphaproteobacteria bacterium]